MKLKKEYKKGGYLFTFLRKVGEWYIYEKAAYEYDKDPGERGDKNIRAKDVKPHWEVVTPVPSFEWKDVKHGRSQGWLYPRSSQWGRNGFTLMSVERVHDKIFELTGVDISNDNKMIFPDWYDWEVDAEIQDIDSEEWIRYNNDLLYPDAKD